MNVKNKAALVTGASRGLGAALMAELVERGARVVGVARGAVPLEERVAEVRARGGVAYALAGDVSDPAAPHALAGAAAALVGPIDLLVHNASTLGAVPLAPLGDTPDGAFEAALATNLVGPFRLTRAIVGAMVVRGGGLVVHVTSDAGREAYPHWGAYGVSKAGFDQLARIWAAELADTGVRFLTVDPGEMDTQMHAEAMPEADRSALTDPKTAAARIVAQIEAAP